MPLCAKRVHEPARVQLPVWRDGTGRKLPNANCWLRLRARVELRLSCNGVRGVQTGDCGVHGHCGSKLRTGREHTSGRRARLQVRRTDHVFVDILINVNRLCLVIVSKKGKCRPRCTVHPSLLAAEMSIRAQRKWTFFVHSGMDTIWYPFPDLAG